MDQSRAAGCYSSFEGNRLTVGNRLIERTWVVRGGRLVAERFEHRPTGRQWIVAVEGEAAPGDAGFAYEAEIDSRSPVSAASLRVVLRGPKRTYRLRVYPEASGVEVQVVTAAAATAVVRGTGEQPSGVESDAPVAEDTGEPAADVVEHLVIDPLHVRLTEVTLADQTDVHDTLVFERSWLLGSCEGPIASSGNLFWLENVLNGEGLIALKLAPLPHARPVKGGPDLRVRGGELSLCDCGGDDAGEGYPVIVLSYSGGRIGRIAALQAYQRQVRPYVSGRDGLLLSNTWGDRSRDARINAAFIAQEIDAARQLGVDVVQIDDGWQRGTTANSVNRDKGGVWIGFWAADERFWEPHPDRFPAGIRQTVDYARAAELKMGLWFAPDSADDFANWERDAAAVLRMHREWGVDYVKIDGVKAHSRRGERNLRRFFDAVLEASQGRVVFDLDVTAEVRPGYFGMMHVGPIFVENRYTDWRRYWPHRTLRNLWMLAPYVDPLRLRMEFLNNRRNTERYGDDPLAPARYEADYLFATVMFANPLGWFEISNLPVDYRQRAATLVRTWKAHRDHIFAGTIVPIGEEPDGTRWTGLASIAPDRRSAYVLVFRERNPRAEWHIGPDQMGLAARRVERLAGAGDAMVDGDGLRVKISEPLRFVLLRVSGQ